MKTRKILSLIIALAIILCTLPLGTLTASAADYTTTLNGATLYFSVSNGEATITDCDTSISGDVTIPSTLGGYPVTSIGCSAFNNCNLLTSVTIPDSVTSISEWAFDNCDSLDKVNITDLAAWCNIDFHSYYCSPLNYERNLYINGTLATNITIPDSVTKIKDFTFFNLDSLTSVTIPDSVTSIGFSSFNSCSSLTQVTIPYSVTSIDISAFAGCSSLTSITIPNSVTNISDYAFYDCSSLTQVTIPDDVTNIGYRAFEYCSSLTSITIPNNVASIDSYAFKDCSSLKTVYYCGTETQWNKINIGSNNENLLNANIIFYCSCDSNDFTDWKTTVQPTCTKEGKKERSCNNCGEKQTEIIPMIEHNLADGNCIMCGNEIIIIESEHNYANNTNKTWTVTRKNAVQMIITFSGDTFVEKNYDFIYVYDKNNNQIGIYTDSELTSKTIIVEGDTVSIKLTSDGSSTKYGFKAEIIPLYPENSVIGDISGDNKLDSSDVVLMKKAVLNISELTAEEIEAYDLNGDNKLDILDLIRIKKLIANL